MELIKIFTPPSEQNQKKQQQHRFKPTWFVAAKRYIVAKDIELG